MTNESILPYLLTPGALAAQLIYSARMGFADKYLNIPSQFPGSCSGAPWGEDSVAIDLAGGPYIFNGLSQYQADEIRKRFGKLCRPASSVSGVVMDVFRSDPGIFKKVDFTGQEYTFDQSNSSGSVRLAGQNFMSWFHWPDNLAAGLWISDHDTLVSFGILENVFRALVAYRLLEMGGVLLHSGAVVWGEKARLFIGRSGAGKSTISGMGLDAGFDVLSDDMNALVPGKDGFIVEKLPFAGDLGQTSTPKGSYPVQGIYRLEQDQENQLVALSPAKALAALMACSPYVNGDPRRYGELTDNLTDLIGRVSVKKLHFSKDGGFWGLLE